MNLEMVCIIMFINVFSNALIPFFFVIVYIAKLQCPFII